MEVIKETSCRSRFALFICSVDSRLPVKQMKRFLKKKKLRKRIRNYVSENVPKSSKVYQVIRAPFLRKSVVFAKMVYKSLNHKMNNIASKLAGDIETNPGRGT